MTTETRLLDGRYELLEKLGEGGMGAIYKVRHRLLNELRVIKVLRPQLLGHENVRARFLREARVASQVRHPNVAQLYDCSIDDTGMAHIVMEFIDGVTLKDVLRHAKALPVAQALEIARQALRALGHLHRAGIVHRDVSPDNIMLTRGPEGGVVVKLIDLGIAKVLVGESEIRLTETGMFVGKMHYASPESFGEQGPGTIDARSDLYSFGIVLYELLTDQHPIAGETPESLVAGHLFTEPLDFAVSDAGNTVPQEVRDAVLRALAKAKEHRPDSAEDFFASLHSQRYPCSPEALGATFEEVYRRTLASAGHPAEKPSTLSAPPRPATPSQPGHHASTILIQEPSPTEATELFVPNAGPKPRKKHTGVVAAGAVLLILVAAISWWRAQSGTQPPERTESTDPEWVEELRRLEDDGDGPVSLRLDGGPGDSRPRVALGSPLRFRLHSRRDGFLVLFGIQPDGALHCFYPNSVRTSLEVEAGDTPLLLPLPADRRAGFEVVTGEPLGRDVVFALLTTERPSALPPGDTSNPWSTTYRSNDLPDNDPARDFVRWVSDLRRRNPAATSLVSLEIDVVASVP